MSQDWCQYRIELCDGRVVHRHVNHVIQHHIATESPPSSTESLEVVVSQITLPEELAPEPCVTTPENVPSAIVPDEIPAIATGTVNAEMPMTDNFAPAAHTRSGRTVKVPAHLTDYELK